MTRLSVNINKIATLRNARGGNNPDVLKAALDCERFGGRHYGASQTGRKAHKEVGCFCFETNVEDGVQHRGKSH